MASCAQLAASEQQHPDHPAVAKFRSAFKRALGGRSGPASDVSDPSSQGEGSEEDGASSQDGSDDEEQEEEEGGDTF